MRFAPPLLASLLFAGTAQAQELTGWAIMPAATFSDGPTSGQFITPNPFGTNLPPYVNKQPVQGFSAVLFGARKNVYHFLVDNGFGAQNNSADSVLRAYTLEINWRTRNGGPGTINPADWDNGRSRAAFDARTRLELNDARHQLTIPIQADSLTDSNTSANPPVDANIRARRLLTGADFDIEGFRRDRHGNYWFGDEFGPYLIKTDKNGTVLRSEISMPGVFAPENKDVVAGRAVANLGSSRGFEGLAINKSGTKLFTLLEGTVAGDPAKTLRIDEFDVEAEQCTGRRFIYTLDANGTNIGDMVAVDDRRFLVLERNGSTATSPNPPPFKKVYPIDIEDVPPGGVARKMEIVDLMRLADPFDLNGDGSTVFTFPYVTIENILVLDSRTILVVNDNNFPFGGGREAASDNTEFLRIRLPVSLVPDDEDDEKGRDRDED